MSPLVRLAHTGDIDQVATLGGHFHEMTAWAKRIPYSHSDAKEWAQLMIDHGLLIVAVDKGRVVGVVGGLKHPFLNNKAYIIGAELLWWIEPEYRNGGLGKELLFAIEQAARDAGCRLWSMMTLENVEPEKAGAIYKKLGYELTEHSYLKELG